MSAEFSDVSSSAQSSALMVWHSINICGMSEQMREWLISDGLGSRGGGPLRAVPGAAPAYPLPAVLC